MLLPSGLLLLIASALAAPSINDGNFKSNLLECGYLGSQFFNRHRRAIIGGQEFNAQDAPWVVRIDTPGGFECTGTLISHRHVITAAHCFVSSKCRNDFNPEEDWSICYKEDKNNRKCGKTGKFRIKEVLLLDRYLKFNCSDSLDISIAELDEPILSGTRICVPTEDTEPDYEKHDDSEVHILGYSDNYDFGQSGDRNTHLRHATTKVNLRSHRGTPTLVSDYDQRAAICGGDSGGPMFEIHNKTAILIGVNRGAEGDCDINGIIPNHGNKRPKQRAVELKQHLDLIAKILRKRGIELN